VQFSTN